MAKRIRITGPGIYGAPTPDNPTGEIVVGTEFDINGDIPPGWKGRAEIVGEEPAEGSIFVTGNGDDSEAVQAIKEKAEAEFKRLVALHADEIATVSKRAEVAEKELADARTEIDDLKAKLATPATAAEIVAAISLLDKGSNDHWTDAGLPRVEAVAEITGKAVTRKAIEEAAPDAKRPTD